MWIHIQIYMELGDCFHFLLLWIMLLCTSVNIYSPSVSTLWGIFPRSGIVGSYGRMPRFMLLFETSSRTTYSHQVGSSPHELGAWASLSTSDWRPFPGRGWSWKHKPLCLSSPCHDRTHHITFNFPNKECCEGGDLSARPPSPQHNSHWGHSPKLHRWSLGWTPSPKRISEPSAASRCFMPI